MMLLEYTAVIGKPPIVKNGAFEYNPSSGLFKEADSLDSIEIFLLIIIQ